MADWNPRANDLFLSVVELTDADARRRLLDEACGADAALRGQVENLLAASARAGSFLEHPAAPPHTETAACAAPSSDPGERAGAVLAGKYKLVEEIGEGGMGSVWMARQTEPVKRLVAVKLIKAGMDSKAVLARFEAERQALAVMDHPNIAKVHDAGTTESGRPFFVMELVKGVPITDYCDERRLTPRERLGLFVPVCQAIQHAHQKGVIHRDIKPSNVLVALYDDKPVPKVIDFGVAKAAGQSLTEVTFLTGFGAVVGTPEYMSPEQASLNNLDVDTRSDVYSLGVLLYELLTGTTPVDRKSLGRVALLEVLRIVREVEAPRPSARLSTLDTLPSVAAARGTGPTRLSKLVRGELDWVVLKALEKDRTRRYDSAGGLARDVERYLAGDAVAAVPPSAIYRVRKFVRRNRAAVLVAAAFLLLTYAGAWGIYFAYKRAVAAEADARAAETRAGDDRAAAMAERDKAVAAEKRATDQTAVAQSVRDFLLKDLLKQADRGWQLDTLRAAGGAETTENPTVRELLNRAAAGLTPDKIEVKFPGQPLVQAEILSAVASTYYGLGDYALAEPLLVRSAALYEQTLGEEHETTLRQLIMLAAVRVHLNRRPDAIKIMERVVEIALRIRPRTDLDSHSVRAELALYYTFEGRTQDAIRLLTELLDEAGKVPGPDGLQMALNAKFHLAMAYHMAKRTEEAIGLMEEIRGPAEEWAKDKGSGALLWGYHNLGDMYMAVGRRKEAIDLYQKVYDGRKRLFNAANPWRLGMQRMLGNALWLDGQTDRAAKVFEEGLAYYRLPETKDEPEILATMRRLCLLYATTGRGEDGLKLAEDVLARCRKAFGADHARTREALNNVALVLEFLGRYDRGAEVADGVIAVCRRQATPDPAQLGTALETYGRCLIGLGRPEDAEPVFRELVAVSEKNPPDHWGRYGSQALLGRTLLGQKKYGDAEKLLLSGYEGMKRRASQIPPEDRRNLPDTVDWLVELYTATGRPDKVTEWRAERAKYPELAPPPRLLTK
jgi:tetratricopeptide (TPR) repeat protein